MSGSDGTAPLAGLIVVRPGDPDQPALIDERRVVRYRELDHLVDSVAGHLLERGVGEGDRVMVSMSNSVDPVVALLAVLRAGAVFVGAHPGLAPVEARRLVVDAAPALALVGPDVATAWAAAGVAEGVEAVVVDRGGAGIGVLAGPPAPHRRFAPTSLAALAYTSGTTGVPKGVMHTRDHVDLVARVIFEDRMGGRGERVGVILPLTTFNVAIIGPLLALVGHGTAVCLDVHEPAAVADAVVEHGIEHLACSPATAHDLVEHDAVRRDQLAGLRLGVGGAACPERLRVAYRERFGRDFTTGYGLTEAPAAVAQETERAPHRRGASGVAMGHVRLGILDENLEEVPSGVDGQIAVRAATTGRWAHRWRGMAGYWGRPGDDATRWHDGWLLTGDQGRLDDDGYVYVAERRSEVINRGGSKVAPGEVETVVRALAGVSDCLVVGVRDERLGEQVAVAVECATVGSLDAATVIDHCRRHLAGHKVPRTVRIVGRLPRNPMGKIVREEVLSWFDPDGGDPAY